MKKIILFLLILLMPFSVYGYSNYIIPGGKTLGIEVENKGVIVIGFYKVNNQFNKNNLRVGDIILKVNDTDVENITKLIKNIEENVVDNNVTLTVKRKSKIMEFSFNLINVNGLYKTGLYVKDSITGIGTLTYIDPESKIYGALGHEIVESSSGNLIEVKTGKIFRSSITSIDRSVSGSAGTKNAKFYSNTIYGSVIKNTNKGIYGIYTGDIKNLEKLKVGTSNTIKEGPAYILTVLNEEQIQKHEIEIDGIQKDSETKNIHFKIISEQLLNLAGGIVQGMSGSPIIQGNNIIGAVTHVIVDNPSSGYGIFITTMLEEGESS